MISLRTVARFRKVAVTAAPLGLIIALAGCGQDDIRVYQAPKETRPALAQPASRNPSAAAAAPTAPPEISWTVPAGWTDKGASGMRAGSFAITGPDGQSADMSVIAMSTWTGQELENVNRWRAQVGQQPLSAEELAQNTILVETVGIQAPMFEMTGTPLDGEKPTRILAAVLSLPQVAWYFKMMGDDELVAAQKSAFVDFLKSVRFEASQPASAADAGAAANTRTAAPADGAKPTWTVPAGWQEQTPGQMQTARYTAGQGEQQAEITFSVLGGTGGGLLANVNRWRTQLGLGSLDEAGLAKVTSPLDIANGTATVVDMSNEAQQRRIVAAVLDRGKATWFYRLSGPEAAVAAHKAAFLQFVQSAQ